MSTEKKIKISSFSVSLVFFFLLVSLVCFIKLSRMPLKVHDLGSNKWLRCQCKKFTGISVYGGSITAAVLVHRN